MKQGSTRAHRHITRRRTAEQGSCRAPIPCEVCTPHHANPGPTCAPPSSSVPHPDTSSGRTTRAREVMAVASVWPALAASSAVRKRPTTSGSTWGGAHTVYTTNHLTVVTSHLMGCDCDLCHRGAIQTLTTGTQAGAGVTLNATWNWPNFWFKVHLPSFHTNVH